MNITLTPVEVLHVLQTVLRSPLPDSSEQEALVSKIERPILAALEKEEDRQQDAMLETWTAQEQKKIADLKQKNLDMRPPIHTARRK